MAMIEAEVQASLKKSDMESILPDEPGEIRGGLWAGVTKYHLLVFAGCWMGGIFDGMDSTLMSVVMPLSLKALVHTADKAELSQIGAYVTSIFLIGWTIGGIFFGMIGDKLGRVKSMIFSILLYALFTGLAGLAQSWEMLAVCRFLTGLGIGGEMVSISTFLTEVWPARTRAIALGVLITSYQAGVFIAGGVHYFFTDWRMAFFVGALPALLVIFLRMAMKESDKWVEAKEKQHGISENVSHFRELFQPRNVRSLFVGGFIFAGLLLGYWASLSWIPMWVQDLLGSDHRGSERMIVTMYQGIAAIVGCAMSGWLAEKIGRKGTIVFSYLGCFVASALLFLTNQTFNEAIYWQTAILGYFIGMAQAIMYVYLPELFPTLVRATGTGFCLNVGRITTAIGVLFMGSLVSAFNGYAGAAFFFALFYLVAVVAALFGHETKGKPLPE